MRRLAMLAAVLGGPVTIVAQPSTAQPDQPTALVHAHVVDVRDGRVTPNATIVLRDGRLRRSASDRCPRASAFST
jgi:hypothetical protein